MIDYDKLDQEEPLPRKLRDFEGDHVLVVYSVTEKETSDFGDIVVTSLVVKESDSLTPGTTIDHAWFVSLPPARGGQANRRAFQQFCLALMGAADGSAAIAKKLVSKDERGSYRHAGRGIAVRATVRQGKKGFNDVSWHNVPGQSQETVAKGRAWVSDKIARGPEKAPPAPAPKSDDFVF